MVSHGTGYKSMREHRACRVLLTHAASGEQTLHGLCSNRASGALTCEDVVRRDEGRSAMGVAIGAKGGHVPHVGDGRGIGEPTIPSLRRLLDCGGSAGARQEGEGQRHQIKPCRLHDCDLYN